MKDYQKRLVEEYKQLKERLVQLDNFVKEQEGFGVEESKVGHPIEIFKMQYNAMKSYC